MSEIRIPPAALEAGARAIAESLRTARLTTEAQDGYKPEARAAITAALEAWPGMDVERFMPDSGPYTIHLPLPKDGDDE